MIQINFPEPMPKISELKEIQREGGIYLLYDIAGVLLYIGKSDNLYKRLSAQLRNMPDAKSFSVVYVENPFERAIYEIAMIHELKPLRNKERF